MQHTPTPQVPKVVFPPQIRQGPTPDPRPKVPTPIQVAKPIVALPPQTQQTIPKPVTLPTPQTVPKPGAFPSPQTVPNPGAFPTPQTGPKPVAFPTPQTLPTVPKLGVTAPGLAQGGLLRQFGGGGGTTVLTGPQVTAAPTVTIVTETGYSILSGLLPIWNGTEEQTKQLVALQYTNGNFIIDVKRRDIIMEIIGMLQYQSFEDTLDFLTDAPNPEFVLWDQASLDEGRIKVAREITIQQAEEVGVKGVGRCRYCPSTELVFAMKQLRSGDEPATIFVRCVMCNKQWRQ